MYVLDYLAASESPRSVPEIAEGSIYSRPEVAEACTSLLERGLIENQNRGEYTSNERTESKIQDDIFERIRRSYDLYLKRFAESGAISINADDSEASPYPLKSSVATSPESFRANHFSNVFVGIEDEHFLTRDNNLPSLADLSFRNLERLPILLIKVLWIHISDENREYWRYTYEVLDLLYKNGGSEAFSIKMTIRLLFHLVLSSIDPAPRSPLNNTNMSGGEHSQAVLSNTNFIAAFVAYPALESFLKFRCSSDIEIDGTVKRDGTIRDYSPRNNRDFYNEGDTCSSLCDLLIHFENEIADDRLQKQLELMREEISELVEYPESRIYGLIYQWRNTLSHQGTTDVKFGIILNIICMVIWHDINNEISD